MISFKQKAVRTAAAVTAVGAAMSVGMVGGSPAAADPIQVKEAMYAFGSDTIQDVANGIATEMADGNPTTTGGKVLVSWDAFPAGECIAPWPNFGTILRPNGSSNGQRILSAAKAPSSLPTWPASGTACGGPKPIPSSFVQMARSSSGPGSRQNNTGPAVWVPLGRDALSYAYIKPAGGTLVTNLSSAELTALHSTGPAVIDGVVVAACGIQTGSGTYGTWMDDLGLADDGTGDPGTSFCNDLGGVPDAGGRLQENNGPELTTKGGLLSGAMDPACDGVAGGAMVSCSDVQLVIGFSASQYVARSNGNGSPDPGLEGNANAGMGSIDALPIPVTCTSPSSCSPVAGAYNDPNYGRDVYFVAEFNAVSGIFADPNISDFLSGSSAMICTDFASLINTFGFLSIPNCGDVSAANRGDWRTS